MVFISHTREEKNRPSEFVKNSAHAYQAFLTWTTGYFNCTWFSGAADSVIDKKGGRIVNIFRPRCAATLVLVFLIGCIALANAEVRYHEVRSGDTLSNIAKAHGVSYRHLACLNDIVDPNLISIGQRIELPRTRHESQNLDLKWPLNQGRMTSFFGPRRGACHHGIDIAAPRGTVVRVADDGKVVFSGRQNGYGKVVIVQHAKGYHTLYAHLHTIYVKVKQKVRSGQRIAKVGSTGRSTGPHLHFEVRENGKALDPMAFLPQKTRIALNPKVSSGAARGGK